MERATAVILAGAIQPSPLRRALDVPVLCLPVAADRPLVAAWREALAAVGATDVRIVVSGSSDVDAVGQAAGRRRRSLRIIAEPTAWRGTAGLIKDVTDDLDGDDLIVVVEAACLPPASLAPLLDALGPDDAGVVGRCGSDEPAGVHLLRRAHLAGRASGSGYLDLKEQLLPSMHRDGLLVRTAWLGERTQRIRDRRTYLEAVRTELGRRDVDGALDAGPNASVSRSAIFDGFCVVQPGAVVEDGAVVHESVVMNGATICGGAVVTRSVVGPMATIAARRRVVREVIVRNGAAAAHPSPQRQMSPAP